MFLLHYVPNIDLGIALDIFSLDLLDRYNGMGAIFGAGDLDIINGVVHLFEFLVRFLEGCKNDIDDILITRLLVGWCINGNGFGGSHCLTEVKELLTYETEKLCLGYIFLGRGTWGFAAGCFSRIGFSLHFEF